MITFLKGNMVELSPTHAIIDCNGVGYYLNISLNTFSKFENTNESVKFFTHLSIKEDSHTLYGFFDEVERECFILLLSVSGVGASTARMILSAFNPNDLKRIIIDLKDKMDIERGLTSELTNSNDNIIRQESLYALEKLGFSIKRTNPIIDKIMRENPNLSVEEVIKIALKTL